MLSRESSIVILVHAPHFAMWPLLYLRACANSVYQALFLLPLRVWERGYHMMCNPTALQMH